MKTASTLVALAAAAGSTLAAPAEGTGLKFSVAAVKNDNDRHAVLDADQVLRKYASPDTIQAVEAAILARRSAAAGLFERGQNASVITNPYGSAPGVDSLYISEISVGTPAQKLPMDFDTGSSDLWVFSTDTKTAEVKGQKLYKPKNSNTAQKQTGYTWSILYGDQSTSKGVVYKDTVTIGGASVTGQAVESAQDVSGSFTSNAASSGLVGLAYDKGNTIKPTPQKTWFSNIKSSLAAPLFTARLKHSQPGSYNFGYIDKSQYTGDIYYTKAYTDRLGHRLFDATGYAVGDNDLNDRVISGTADTGTSLVYLPTDVAEDYWSNVDGSYKNDLSGGQYLWTFPCDYTLPTLSFGVGSGRITVHSDNINFAPNKGNTCIGGLGGIDDTLAIFGDVAMKSGFVVYDDGNNQLGWAEGA